MTVAVSDFISRLVVHFGEPKFDVSDTDKPRAHKAWLRDMVANLGGFGQATLQKAADIVLSTRKRRDFPLISECKQACIEADRWAQSQKPNLPLGRDPTKSPEWSDARLHLADDLCLTPLGRRAAQEDWILAYWNFCRDNARAPQTDGEIRKCIANARGFDEAFENCRAGRCGPLSRHLTTLGTSMLQRREDLKAMVLDGVVR